MNALETDHLTKRFRRADALRDCTLAVPSGRVVGIVGTNGAGKSTLLHLAVGLLRPTEGSIRVLGEAPAGRPEQLTRVGFLAQDAPVYSSLTVAEHLRLGDGMNDGWDRAFAAARIARLGLDPGARAGRLSGGERSQLALTLAMAKRPDLLVLDEPVSSLDPLARREFLGDLMEIVAEQEPTVILSSHSLADVERVCDHLVILAGGRVRLAGDIDELLVEHRRLTGGRGHDLPAGTQAVQSTSTDRQTTVIVRSTGPVLDPRWEVAPVGLEELVLAYLSASEPSPRPAPLAAVQP
jgi:ABC-2 type transport system ATP-binding protein